MPLSEAEADLFRRAQGADSEDRDAALRSLSAQYRPLAGEVARRLFPHGPGALQLERAARDALARLLTVFEPAPDADFAGYARAKLRGEMERGLFALAQTVEVGDGAAAREALLALYERLALSLARRFAERGEPVEDLEQVARLGLLSSIRRFDPDRGVQFATYATQTIVGELKKHFRDRGWGLHVPRSMQELNLAARKTADALTQELGRSPTIAEIAGHLGKPTELTLEALELGQQAYELLSLDETPGDDDEGAVGEAIARPDASGVGFRELAEAKVLLDGLPKRLRLIVVWRHLAGLSQTEIARKLGISQMHVSRLYRKAIIALQELVTEGEGKSG